MTPLARNERADEQTSSKHPAEQRTAEDVKHKLQALQSTLDLLVSAKAHLAQAIDLIAQATGKEDKMDVDADHLGLSGLGSYAAASLRKDKSALPVEFSRECLRAVRALQLGGKRDARDNAVEHVKKAYMIAMEVGEDDEGGDGEVNKGGDEDDDIYS